MGKTIQLAFVLTLLTATAAAAESSFPFVPAGFLDIPAAVTLDGGEITRWGDPESLQLPHLMAIAPDGRLLVTEVRGKRVQIFRPVRTRP